MELFQACSQSPALMDTILSCVQHVVAVVDPMTSQIGPEQFREFVSPHAAPIFEHIRQAGAVGSFFVCGPEMMVLVRETWL